VIQVTGAPSIAGPVPGNIGALPGGTLVMPGAPMPRKKGSRF
jgi:hypothetical protein